MAVDSSQRGRRLLPSVVDELARTEPDRVIYSFTKTADPNDQFHDITISTFARAVNRCSWHIERLLGKGNNFPTVAYVGPQNLTYAVLLLACIKTGYKLLLISPRNTLEAHLHLFEQTECNTLMIPENFPSPVIKQILERREIRLFELPEVDHWFEDGEEELYPYQRTFEDAEFDPFVVLHTSGSTGKPKPIVQTHSTVAALDALAALSAEENRPTFPASCAGARIYTTFPFYHCGGLHMLLPAPILAGFTVVLGPSPPSAQVANSIHLFGNVQQSCLPPMTIIELCRNPEHIENLAKLDQITFGSGNLPKNVGDAISSKTRLLNCLGATEVGILPAQLCDKEDWACMSISPVIGSEYRHLTDDLYEHYIVRDEKLRSCQAVFGTFPHLKEWSMKDVYSKHPSKENVWMYRGRTDDITVFSTGEKLNPLGMEETVEDHPLVHSALIGGFNRFQSCLLIEPEVQVDTEDEKNKLLDGIWPSVMAANKLSPSFGRVHRRMIILAAPDRPFLRTAKGNIQREATLDLYATELDGLYNSSNETYTNGTGEEPSLRDPNIDENLQAIIERNSELIIKGLPSTINLFDLGLDSLQVTAISREISLWLSSTENMLKVLPRVVCSNPTMQSLTKAISGLLHESDPLKTAEEVWR